MWKCYFFHKWGKWIDIKAIFKNEFTKETYERLGQRRACERCGKCESTYGR